MLRRIHALCLHHLTQQLGRVVRTLDGPRVVHPVGNPQRRPTLGGFREEVGTSVDQKLGDVKRVAMTKLKLDACQADEFVVTLIGNVLDENKTLAELDLADCLVLTIERKEVVKI